MLYPDPNYSLGLFTLKKKVSAHQYIMNILQHTWWQANVLNVSRGGQGGDDNSVLADIFKGGDPERAGCLSRTLQGVLQDHLRDSLHPAKAVIHAQRASILVAVFNMRM